MINLREIRKEIDSHVSKGKVCFFEWILETNSLDVFDHEKFRLVSKNYNVGKSQGRTTFAQTDFKYRIGDILYPVRFFSWYNDDSELHPLAAAIGMNQTGLTIACIDGRNGKKLEK